MKLKQVQTKLSNHDRKTFELIYRHYYEFIFRVIYAKTKLKDITEDLTQDTFIKWLEKAPEIEDLDEIGKYLCRIALNLCCDYFRRRSFIVEDQNGALVSGTADAVALERYQNSSQTHMQMEIIRSTLTEFEYLVLILHAIDGYTFKDMASLLCCAEPKVRRTYKLAVEKSVEALNDSEQIIKVQNIKFYKSL